MSETIEAIDYKGYTIKVYRDECGESPREWDNLGTMAFCHRNYNLGDEQMKHPHELFLLILDDDTVYRIAGEGTAYCEYWDDETVERLWKEVEKRAVILPLYLYDHSGITIRTSPFSCPWDSGQVGWIFVTKEAMRKEYGKQRISKQLRARVTAYLGGEVETYDNFLTGQVYGYVVEDQEGEHIDSCWGFYGYKSESWDYMLSEAKSMVDWRIEESEREKQEYIKRHVAWHTERVKQWIRSNVPLVYREELRLDLSAWEVV